MDKMDSSQAENYYSCESDSSTESGVDLTSQKDNLSFCTKISEELQAHFKRNSENEDFCDDIYENIYTTPASGSYSYYTDLLAMAQFKEPVDNGRIDPEASNFTETTEPITLNSESHCSWMSSGYHDPTFGIGPLEDLFRVLDPSKHVCCLSPRINIDSCWSEGFGMTGISPGEILCNSSLDDGYSDFIDIFHRWTSDTFPMEFPSSNANEF